MTPQPARWKAAPAAAMILAATTLALAPYANVPLRAQTGRDFLTADEVDQIRLTALDPNARLKTYATFARLRVDMVASLAKSNKPGQSGIIHQTLEDYTKIIEAIDVVADDALKRGTEIAEGMQAVADAEKEMLSALQSFEESSPKDLTRYRFALTTAIETTEDSLELSQQDLAARKADVTGREAADKKAREAMMTPDEVKLRRTAEKKQEETETKQKRKAPTLRRKGETAKQP
ncbi:MAG: hypothetical protein R2762_09885 [Bryobacteraceae bacterium]